MVTPIAANYMFSGLSTIDTSGYLYKDAFYSNSPTSNLIAFDDDSGSNRQFQFSIFLQANVTYVLIVTAPDANTTGPYSVMISGPVIVHLLETNSTSLLTSTSTSGK